MMERREHSGVVLLLLYAQATRFLISLSYCGK